MSKKLSKFTFFEKEKKPRETGINYVRSPVLIGKSIQDYLDAYSDMVDILKLSANNAING